MALTALGLAWYQERQAARKSLYQVKYELLQARQDQHVWDYAMYSGYMVTAAAPAMTTKMTEAQIDEALKFYRVAHPAQ